jgi:hypothetical protein
MRASTTCHTRDIKPYRSEGQFSNILDRDSTPYHPAPGIQWRARYTSTCSGSTLCLKNDMGTPLFERPVKKYTSSNSMVKSYVPIQNPFSATSQRPIICSSNKISLFIFCNLKNLRKPQARKAARVRGLHKAAKSSISCSLSFHSIMAAEVIYKTKKPRNPLFPRFGNFGNFKK